MNDICFEMNLLRFAWEDCIQTEKQVRVCTHSLRSVTKKTEQALRDFRADANQATESINNKIRKVKDLIRTLSQKCAAANSKNDKTSDDNEWIDAYVSACNEAIHQLERIVAQLQQLESDTENKTREALLKTRDFYDHARLRLDQSDRTRSAMEQYCHAFYQVYEDAQILYALEGRPVANDPQAFRQFQIRNSHTSGGQGTASVGFGIARTPKSQSSEGDSVGEMRIPDRDPEAFLEKAEGASCFAMPSANLHKLGGKDFVSRMNEMGFCIVTQPDGSAIDVNGMIHWERKHE